MQSTTLSSQSDSQSKVLMVVGFLSCLLIVGGLGYYLGRQQSPSTLQTSTPNELEDSQLVSSQVASQTSPSSDTPSNWDTFIDRKSGISFRYPKGWTVKAASGWEFFVYLDNKPFEIPTETQFKTPIQVYVNEVGDATPNTKRYSHATVEESVRFLKNYFYGENVTEKQMIIHGRKATQISGNVVPGMLQGLSFTHTLIQLDNKVLIISLEKNNGVDEIYHQIVSSIEVE